MIRYCILSCIVVLGVCTGIFGIPSGYPVLTSLFPILFAIPTYVVLFRTQRFRSVMLVLLSLSIFAIGIETIGVMSGFPYGRFYYTDLFMYKLFGTTPIIVPFGWIPIVIGAYAISQKITPSFYRYVFFIVLLLAADAIIDPGAVRLGMWWYVENGLYYGVPWSNFFGWVLSGTIGYSVLRLFFPNGENYQIQFLLICLILYWTGVSIGLGLLIPSLLGCLFTGILRKNYKDIK